MAAGTNSLALALTLSAMLLAQRPRPDVSPTVELREIQNRTPPSYTPTLFGQRVSVTGVVSTRAVNFGEYAHLPIQDTGGSGAILEKPRGALDAFVPGDVVRASGAVNHRAGLPVVVLDNIAKTGQVTPPQPVKVRHAAISRFENVGAYITLDSYVITPGQNAGGDILVIGGGNAPNLTIFYPRFFRRAGPGLTNFSEGDKIRVTGIASQYCPVEPYDRGFQVLIDRPDRIEVLERGWVIPPATLLYGLMGLLVASGIWWMRERRMAEHRLSVRSMMALSEEVLSANSVGEIVRKVESVLPAQLNASKVDLFLFNRTRNALDRVPGEQSSEPFSIPLDQPSGGIGLAATVCFRNRAMLHIPDFRRSPLLEAAHEPGLPASAVFVPMVAQGEILGVMSVQFRKRNHANRSQQAALQHVANQIAASLKLQEQQSIREQLLRSEKMAAAGQLISGVAHDLRAPLQMIHDVATRLKERGGAEEDMIAVEADRGLRIVSHLLSFARMERSEARAVNLHLLVSEVMEARESEWKRKGIMAEKAVPVSPVEVFADESELEQVVLSLLIHAEQAVSDRAEKHLRVSSRVLGSRLQISIDFPCPPDLARVAEEPSASGDSFGLSVCQAIAQSHGGDIRLYEVSRGGIRYELELPVYHAPAPLEEQPSGEPVRHAARILTTMLVEPDASVQRRLLALLSIRGHRAIPVETADEAADMCQRMAFDVVFCTSHLPGLSWAEFFKRVRRRILAFVLLAETYDNETRGVLKDGVGFIIRKPLEENELDTVLAEVEARHGGAKQ